MKTSVGSTLLLCEATRRDILWDELLDAHVPMYDAHVSLDDRYDSKTLVGSTAK
jgi:hypothetical protein